MSEIIKRKLYGNFSNNEINEINLLLENTSIRMSKLHADWEDFSKSMTVKILKSKDSFILIYETRDSYNTFTKILGTLESDLIINLKSKVLNESEVYRLTLSDENGIWTDFSDERYKSDFINMATSMSIIRYLKSCYSFICKTSLNNYET